MAIPVKSEEVAQVLEPLLGQRLVQSCPIVEEMAALLRGYAPYRQGLEAFRNKVEDTLASRLQDYTRGSMLIIADNYQPVPIRKDQLFYITDCLMGVLFENLTPFSANFIKLNDYSLRVQSLSALRVLLTRYASYYTKEDLRFMAGMIRSLYPPRMYQGWLPMDW